MHFGNDYYCFIFVDNLRQSQKKYRFIKILLHSALRYSIDDIIQAYHTISIRVCHVCEHYGSRRLYII
jgi:hypothetical protein